jgi:uncharacterized Zn-binding protein involved in type VI secretion
MSKEVHANGMAIACKAGAGKVVAAFPSVCQSPPSPPTGPIPVPYPLSSRSRDLKCGSKQVKIGGQPVALQGQSYYQTKPLGNEAATRNFGASIVTHQTAGKTQFAAGSIDVKFEGKKVCRHLDLTTSNHGSEPGEGPSPGLENARPATEGEPGKLEKCPCCNEPLHPNQFDPDTGEPYETIDEIEWYQSGADKADAIFRRKTSPSGLAVIEQGRSPEEAQRILREILRKRSDAKNAMQMLREARANGSDCPNMHQPGDPCATFFKKTNPRPDTSTAKGRKAIGFDDPVARKVCREWRAAGHDWTRGSEIIHKTPLSAGGCPNGKNNLVPKGAVSAECLALDDAQTKLQGYVSFAKPS